MRRSIARLAVGWLKGRWRVILYFVLFIVILFVVYGLYGLPWGNAGYAALLGTVVGAVVAAVSFARYAIICRDLEKLPGRFPLGQLPPPRDGIDAAQQAVITALEDERVRLAAQREARRREDERYYTLWAHQIKTPIAAMRLLLQKTGEDAGRVAEDAALAHELAKVEQYVGMVLQYLRLSSFSDDLVFGTHSVEGLVKRAVKNLAPMFIYKGLPLNLGTLAGTVVTDEKWMVFVLEQLLTNALKYTHRGGVSVATEAGGRLVITDTGIGIPPEDLPLIFHRGYTGAAGRADGRATGIGLYLCREITARLGFGLRLEPAPGGGTRAVLALAQRRVEAE